MSERRCIVSSTQQRNSQWDTAEKAVAEALRTCLPKYEFQVLILDEGRGPILDVHTHRLR
jgi:hypothetical protein